jgi:histone H3/H4
MGRKVAAETETKTKAMRSKKPLTHVPTQTEGVTKPARAKLARRGGMERVPQVAQEYLETQNEYQMYMIVRAAIIVTLANNRRKITVDDVALASRLALGKELVGFRAKKQQRKKTSNHEK